MPRSRGPVVWLLGSLSLARLAGRADGNHDGVVDALDRATWEASSGGI